MLLKKNNQVMKHLFEKCLKDPGDAQPRGMNIITCRNLLTEMRTEGNPGLGNRSDNGTQFNGELFTVFCERNKIIKILSSVSRPQANGQVEVVNKTLKDTMKKNLDVAKGRWVDELPQVLWAHRTTEKTAMGHTPFSLAFGSEAMLPVEANNLTHIQEIYNQEENQELLKLSLDLLDEKRTES
ncbi:uncharacterized protein LOC133037013 [Cannabis sativa]|uniref:uncharacterized protein LOC133037013 n=1 Tax=Cannabis sativa TaxID=3483 RepID=UPI0029CA8E1A|nr:uncharacterized protein LOC133037013 [Cannabis sativa]